MPSPICFFYDICKCILHIIHAFFFTIDYSSYVGPKEIEK